MPHLSLAVASRFIVAFSATLALAAVFTNFLLAKDRSAMRSEQRSPVATGTMLGFFALLYLILRLRVTERPVPPWVLIAGLVLLVAGTAVNLLGRLNLGGNWGDQVVVYHDHTLVARGAYRWVRHPLYASLVWMGVGAALVFGNPLALAAVLGLFLPAMRFRARQEETVLTQRFPGYAQYQRSTGMFLPKPWLK